LKINCYKQQYQITESILILKTTLTTLFVIITVTFSLISANITANNMITAAYAKKRHSDNSGGKSSKHDSSSSNTHHHKSKNHSGGGNSDSISGSDQGITTQGKGNTNGNPESPTTAGGGGAPQPTENPSCRRGASDCQPPSHPCDPAKDKNCNPKLTPTLCSDGSTPDATGNCQVVTGLDCSNYANDERHFNNQMQKSINRSFEIIELNVDEPILFQKGKWRKRLFERKVSSGDNTDKNEKRKIMLVIPR
jgi:hypothetical protein